MSYLLNHIDNNHSEDDEGDHINRLFPKCKPRASSLSLSPSLQHIVSHNSPSSTSVSDFCLTSSSSSKYCSTTNYDSQKTHNSNLSRLEVSSRNQYSKGQQQQQQQQQQQSSNFNSTNNKFNQLNDEISSHPNNFWGSEDIFSSNSQEGRNTGRCAFENNNLEPTNNAFSWENLAESGEPLNNSSSVISSSKVLIGSGTTSGRGDHHNQRLSSSHIKQSNSGSGRKCENHQQKHSSLTKSYNNNKCDRGRSSAGNRNNNNNSVFGSSTTTNQSGVYFSPSGPQPHQETRSKTTTDFPASTTVISQEEEEAGLLCNLKKPGLPPVSPASLNSSSGRKMEANSIEDNFVNGCSRSSGESTHSNTSDFMENLVSPVASIRSRVVSGSSSSNNGSGVKGHTNNPTTTPLTPSSSTTTATTSTGPPNGGGSLRDSRIEIAGGREIYSQNRIRASRRHRGGSSTHGSNNSIASNEIMSDHAAPQSCTSNKQLRKKSSSSSLHSSHPMYQQQQQHHHCCHNSSPCCATSAVSNNCEVSSPPQLPPHGGSLAWEPNHSCGGSSRRASSEMIGGGRQQQQQQYHLSHSHSQSFGTCVNCTGSVCGCCGGHHGFDYPKLGEFGEGNNTTTTSRVPRGVLSKVHNNSTTSSPPVTTTGTTVRETIFASEVRSIEKSSTPRGSGDKPCSRNLQHLDNSPCRIEPVIYEAVVGDGKVVFDDINEWRQRLGGGADNGGYDGGDEHDVSESQGIKKRQMHPLSSKDKEEISSSGASSHPLHQQHLSQGDPHLHNHHHHHQQGHHNHHHQHGLRNGGKGRGLGGFDGLGNNLELCESSPCTSNRDGNTTPSGYESDECSASACTNISMLSTSGGNFKSSPHNNFLGGSHKRLIGNLPIAEYEGSPKRYGLKQTAQAVTTHFDLIDVDMGVEEEEEEEEEVNSRGDNDDGQIINDSRTIAPTLIDQTITAAASSSSSSLDNTNTNVSSNSSSRTNNRISSPMRALSPSQPISAAFSARFPGFPQRVNASVTLADPQSSQIEENEVPSGPLLDCSPPNKPHENRKKATGEFETPGRNNNCEQLVSIVDCCPGESGSIMTTHQDSVVKSSDQNASSSLLDNFNLIDSPEVPRSTTSELRNQDFLYEFSETRKVLEEFFSMGGGEDGGGGGEGNLELDASSTTIAPSTAGADKASFDELDYMLKRQTGNSYVGQRLASDVVGNLVTEDSPKKPPRRGVLLLGSSDGDGDGSDEKGSPKLISFQEISLPHSQAVSMHSYSLHPQQFSSSQQQKSSSSQSSCARSPRCLLKAHSSSSHHPHHLHHQLGLGLQPQSSSSQTSSRSQASPPLHDPIRDINDNDIGAETASTTNSETDLGETEVGRQVGRGCNFALSPETTDCDSNELESEPSLDYEGSLHPSCRSGRIRNGDGVVGGGMTKSSMVPLSLEHHHGVLSSGNESENEEIIEVDVGYRLDGGGDCFLMSSKIKPSCPSSSSSAVILTTKRQQNDFPCDAKLLFSSSSGEDNKENILGIGKAAVVNWTHADNNSGNLDDEPANASHHHSHSSSNGGGDSNSSTLMLMKKQISEIEKEIQLRASQQSQSQKGPSNNEHGSSKLLVDQTPEIDMNDQMNELPDPSSSPTSNIHTHRLHHIDSTTQSKNPFVTMAEMDVVEADSVSVNHDPELDALDPMRPTPPPSPAPGTLIRQGMWTSSESGRNGGSFTHQSSGLAQTSVSSGTSPPSASVAAAIQDIKEAIQRAKPLPSTRNNGSSNVPSCSSGNGNRDSSNLHSRSGLLDCEDDQSNGSGGPQENVPLICDSSSSPVWVPRHRSNRNRDPRADSQGATDPLLKKQRYEDTPDDDADTDQETDRLLGQTRTEDDCGFYDEKDWKKPKTRSLLPSLNKGVAFVKSATSAPSQGPLLSTSASISGGGSPNCIPSSNSFNSTTNTSTSNNNSFPNPPTSSTAQTNNSSLSSSSSQHLLHSLSPSTSFDDQVAALTAATSSSTKSKKEKDGVKKKRSKEDFLKNPSVLIEGVLFRAKYLGSTQLTCEGQPTKATRMMQAEEAVSRIKADTNEQESSSEQPVGPGPAPSSSTSLPTTPRASESVTNKSTPTSFRSARGYENATASKDTSADVDDYFYGQEEEEEDEDSCEGDSETEEDLFLKAHHHHHRRSSVGSLRDNNGARLPSLEDIHSNALQLHDNHAHLPSSSLHHNRQSSTTGSDCPTSQQPSFLNLSPPCGSALPGTMFRLRFIGSLEVDEEIGTGKRRRKRPKKTMVEEAVMKMKAPEGETQPSTEVDLFISTEKIMVLNTDLKEIMMDHALRTISYIADIGDLVVLMARRRPVPTDPVDDSKPPRPPKMICHVFESDEAQYIAQSIGQAFQVAYMEFLKANGIEDSSFVREMDYQEVLNSQEIFGDELQMFAKKELQKEVVVPKTKGEILGVVIVESGWGSMLPTVVIANLAPAGAAARCGQLNIGDQIIAINGVSLVGLPLSTCQNYIKNTKNQTVVKLTVVPCPPVVEVKIKRPDTKYQLGFSVQNGVICSLLRGGIAERGGVRVGHRIIEINSQSVVAVPHEKIVNLLATSVGEINMKTMPTSMFRLLTGQETPLYI